MFPLVGNAHTHRGSLNRLYLAIIPSRWLQIIAHWSLLLSRGVSIRLAPTRTLSGRMSTAACATSISVEHFHLKCRKMQSIRIEMDWQSFSCIISNHVRLVPNEASFVWSFGSALVFRRRQHKTKYVVNVESCIDCGGDDDASSSSSSCVAVEGRMKTSKTVGERGIYPLAMTWTEFRVKNIGWCAWVENECKK